MEKIWLDKYRPKLLEQLDYNQTLSQNLRKLAKSVDFPHLLIYGPNGSGKKTRVMAFLQEIYGAGVNKIKSEQKELKIGSQSIELKIFSSNFHLDITPSDSGYQDRIIIQKILKDIAQNENVENKSQKGYKVVILNQSENLTKEAQAGLRRTMEKYIEKCKLILITDNLSQIISPLKSRCLLLRVSAPQNQEIVEILNKISKKENLDLPLSFLEKIAIESQRNLRRAILQLQTCRVRQFPQENSIQLHIPEWKKAIRTISTDIIQEQSLKQLAEIREKIQDLLCNCIPPELILKCIMEDFLGFLDNQLKFELIHYSADYENMMQQGQKPKYFLENFILKIMCIYKQYNEESSN